MWAMTERYHLAVVQWPTWN